MKFREILQQLIQLCILLIFNDLQPMQVGFGGGRGGGGGGLKIESFILQKSSRKKTEKGFVCEF